MSEDDSDDEDDQFELVEAKPSWLKKRKGQAMSLQRKGQKTVTDVATSKKTAKLRSVFLKPVPKPLRGLVTRRAIATTGRFQRKSFNAELKKRAKFLKFLPKSLTGTEMYVGGDYDYEYEEASHGATCSMGACVIL